MNNFYSDDTDLITNWLSIDDDWHRITTHSAGKRVHDSSQVCAGRTTI